MMTLYAVLRALIPLKQYHSAHRPIDTARILPDYHRTL